MRFSNNTSSLHTRSTKTRADSTGSGSTTHNKGRAMFVTGAEAKDPGRMCRVVLKRGDEQFWVMAHAGPLESYKRGDRSIPLVDVVDHMEVFHGSTKGEPQRPQGGLLRGNFETTNTADIVQAVLTEGEVQ